MQNTPRLIACTMVKYSFGTIIIYNQEKEEIRQNPYNKTDQDFEGYPDSKAKNETIKPKTKQ